MNRTDTLHAEWLNCFSRLHQGEFFRMLGAGLLKLEHYKAFLRETYHNASHNPKKMALFMAHLDSDQPSLEAKFLRHAAMEIGHGELALEDLRIIGGDADTARNSRPLPTTEALTAFIVFQIQHRNPLAYLGYLYHLEAMPAHMGASSMAPLLSMGVPASATSFLREHAEADPVHVKWNREYLEGFIGSDEDMEAVLYGMRGTCELHGIMFQGIMDQCRGPQEWIAMPAAEKTAP